MDIWTIGHSTHSLQELVTILQAYEIQHVIDVRSLPGSRKFPHFNKESLELSLPAVGMAYTHIKKLGGYRKAKNLVDQEINSAWRNSSFHNYADYMQLPDFLAGLESAVCIANKERCVLMCAEAVPWRCHRSLIGDALLIRDWNVWDIFDLKHVKAHKLTSFAKVDGLNITYPKDKE